MKHLFILHENQDWLRPLITYLREQQIVYTLWFIEEGVNGEPLDFSKPPPDGIYYNRASCSSHTRGNTYSNVLTKQILYWLESHHRIVVNGSSAFDLETSKTLQYLNLLREGILTPKTVTATTQKNILDSATEYPIMLKDNQGGSGSGVYFIVSRPALERHIQQNNYPISPDKLTLIQQRIESPQKQIYRVEIIGGQHLYTLVVDTRDGFNLCPANSCQVENCPMRERKDAEKFKIIENPHPKLLQQYIEFSKKYHLDIVAFEYIVDEEGQCWTYDINCNTNYNKQAEVRAQKTNLSYQKTIQLFQLKCKLSSQS
jgi:hypothetical protein